jgi:hypothetical protein
MTKRMTAQQPQVHVGQRREQTILSSFAAYEVLALEGDDVVVSVIEAPGLMAGHRLRLTRAAVLRMRDSRTCPAGRGDAPRRFKRDA